MGLDGGKNVLGGRAESHENPDGSSSFRVVGGDDLGAEETDFPWILIGVMGLKRAQLH